MNRVRGICVTVSVLMALAAGVESARAELYRDVARGLALLDFQFAGERNVLGDGITVNAGASYNNRTFDFGLAQLNLTGSVSMSAGFTRRGLPGANFSLNSSGLSYDFIINNGIQDMTASGQAVVDVSANINALGFYDKVIQISNRGTFDTDGSVGDNSGTLDFDVGPINVSGNLYADLLAAVTQPIFDAAGAENPFAKLSEQATKLVDATKSIDFLRAKAATGETLSEAEMAMLVNNTIIAAVLGGEPSEELLAQVLASQELGPTSATLTGPVTVPEPFILTPLTLAGAALLVQRRRRAR